MTFAPHRTSKPSIISAVFLSAMMVCISAALLPLTSSAAAHPVNPSKSIEVTFDFVNASSDQAFEVSLNISDVTGQDITAYNLVVLYDATLVTATAASLEGTISGSDGANMTLVYNAGQSGRIAIAAAGVDALTGSGSLVSITFQSTGAGGVVDFEFEELILNEGSPIASGTTGSISVDPPLPGDASLNGEVTAFDAADVLRHAIFVDTLSTAAQVAADVSADAEVSAYDAALILQHVSGLISCFPSEEGCGASKHGSSASADLSWGGARADGMLVHLPMLIDNIQGDVHALTLEIGADQYIGPDYDLDTNLPDGWIAFHSKDDSGTVRITMAGHTPLVSDTLFVFQSHQSGKPLHASARINEAEAVAIDAAMLDETPSLFSLEQNYPNPFNPSTSISYALEEDVEVTLIVYDVLGREVKRLVEGSQKAGLHSVVFDAAALSSGIYLYRLEAGSFSTSRQMMLVK